MRTDCVDSTSLEARRRLAASPGGVRPFVVVAGRQTAGRGRLGRAWASPEGGLWCTFAAPVDEASPIDPMLSLRVGLAMCRTIEAEAGAEAARVRLKWPNDALLDGRKAGGALCEVIQSASGPWRIVGVGINANVDPSELPAEVRPRAASLRHAFGREINIEQLLDALERGVAEALAPDPDPAATLAAIRARLFGVGASAPVTTPMGREELTFLGIDDAGAGRFRDAAGAQRTLLSGAIEPDALAPTPSSAR